MTDHERTIADLREQIAQLTAQHGMVFADGREPTDNERHLMNLLVWRQKEAEQAKAELAFIRAGIDPMYIMYRDLEERLQRSENNLTRLKRMLARKNEAPDLLLVRKNEALSLFADPKMWVITCHDWIWNGDGGGAYLNPVALAKREMEANEPCD